MAIEDKDAQEEKTPSPILEMVFGMEIEERCEKPEKAYFPISVIATPPHSDGIWMLLAAKWDILQPVMA